MRFSRSFGVLFGTRRLSAIALLLATTLSPSVTVAADVSDVFSSARLDPSLSQSGAAAFKFTRLRGQIDAATAEANAFSHFHFDEPAQQQLENAFAKVEQKNVIDPAKVAQLLAKAKRGSAAAMPRLAMKNPATRHDDEASRRIAEAVAPAMEEKPVVLAFASAAPVDEDTPLAAIAKVAPADEDASLASLDPEALALPDEIALPDARPKLKAPVEAAKPEKPAKPQVVQEDEPDKPGERTVAKPAAKVVALAKPEKPEPKDGSFGKSLRNIFGGGTRAGNGVAVYDISAAKVYMPDGSVLRAHSGIGKMADNPKYAHVKMNGPTPPHTYNLRMREKRFHGVEAIRMLPVDGRNKYGRDGFLTHSMLLRGRPNQSHGCVAFADYNKFLKAFKQGKVKQMVVVASGGRAVASR